MKLIQSGLIRCLVVNTCLRAKYTYEVFLPSNDFGIYLTTNTNFMFDLHTILLNIYG